MMPRILVYDHLDQPLFELDPNKVYGLKMVEKVNDEHSLTITTSHELEKGQRIFYHDGEKLREFVVLGDVASHADGFSHEYYCVWSLQYDLSAAYIDDRRIGNKNNLVPASDILTVIAGQSRWQVGTVTTTTVSSAWLYYKSLWEALGIVVENWQGEVDSTIVLSSPVARYIDFKAHVGSSDAKRRFDYGHDLTSIKRTVLDDLYVCRIVPRGKGEAVEGEGGEVSGYGRRITIESVNPTGEEWIQDDSVVPLVRVPNGSGGYEYPTSIVIFDSIETPQVLYGTAMAELETYTRPKMSYEASVLALSGAGMDVDGVSLGDTVHVVDTTFGEDGLRLSARVLGIERDLLEPSNDKLTIGNFQPKMSDTVKDLIDGLSAAQEQLIDTDAKADSAISDASEAAQIAVEAQTVANAVNQHFWVDTDGAHVTEVTKDEWNDTTGSRYHTGANSLWNSLGMLFRKGLTNLLAIVTSNTGGNVTGISIYDGHGNGAENIVASFTNDGVTVGASDKNSMSLGATSMTMLDGDGGTTLEIAPSSASSRKNLSNSFDGVMPTKGNSVTLHLATVPDLSIRSISCRWDVKVGGGSAHTLSANFTSFGTTIPFNESRYVLNVTPNSDGTVTIENISSTAVMPELSKFTFVYSGNGVAPYYRFGNGTSAITGAYGFSHGSDCYPQADNSMASGEWCVAQAPEQHVFGRCNAIDNTSALIIGNGTGSKTAERSNAMTVDWDGNETLAGGLTLGSPLTIANGGTGATTAADAWDALGGGDIGKKDSLAASDIPSLDYTTVDSSAALIDAGRSDKTITAQYSGNAVAATDYVTMWGYYKLVAVTIANLWSKLVSTGIKLKDAIINRDAANPTREQWSGKEITFQDVDGERIAFVNVKRNTNGSIELCVSAENESTSGGDLYNSLNMAIARDGTKSYSVSDAAAFRTAIGVGTIGTKNSLAASDIPSLAASKITSGTLALARGGTGSSQVVSILNNSTWTILAWGPLVMVQCHGATGIADNRVLLTNTLASYKPAYNCSTIVADASSSNHVARLYVEASTGSIRLASVGYTTSAAWYGTLVYLRVPS